LDPKSSNISPLRGIKNVQFISSSDGLINALEQVRSGNVKVAKFKDIFFLDSNLHRWKNLIK